MKDDTIQFDRVCISKELQNAGPFTGFRILELAASNNEGVAVLAVKFARPQKNHNYPVLWLSEFKYYRYGKKEAPVSESEFFHSYAEGAAHIHFGVYPNRD